MGSDPMGSDPIEGEPSQPVTVRELRESPRKPGRYRLALSDGRTLVLGVTALADYGATRVGAVLAPEVLARLVREASVTALADRALAALARGRRTRRELEMRLRRREPDVALVAAALDRLESSGLLSDTEVARAEAASRLRRGEAPARVRQTLRRKGVTDRDATRAIADAVEADGFDELSACRSAADKRMRALAKLEPDVARRRLVAFLSRRGFGGSTIHAVLAEHFGRGGFRVHE